MKMNVYFYHKGGAQSAEPIVVSQYVDSFC